MTDLRIAAQQALEALEAALSDDQPYIERCKQTITDLRTALESSQKNPVAWRTFDGEGGWDYRDYEGNEDYGHQYIKRNGGKYASWVEPLYIHPPQTKTNQCGETCERAQLCPACLSQL